MEFDSWERLQSLGCRRFFIAFGAAAVTSLSSVFHIVTISGALRSALDRRCAHVVEEIPEPFGGSQDVGLVPGAVAVQCAGGRRPVQLSAECGAAGQRRCSGHGQAHQRFRIDYQALDNEIADIEVDVMKREVHVPRLAALEAEMA
ncbi:hypothetical protein [Comamonas thiooxydans]|uniref:hypothetical protein n=1 Tax=Comamonas thiooxydans TaxID=363952 RepID=UPI00265DFA6C|nr:hypothetical protein [Comamonas thiooxydans]MDO1473625.1 hypothetical protein [Comamonas thiooxydans]